MKINIEIDPDRWQEVTNRGQIALDTFMKGKEAERLGLLELIAPFIKDEAGNWMEYDEAIDLLMPIKYKDMLGVVEQFNQACLDFAAPKANGNSSTQPSTTEEQALGGSVT